MESKRLSVGDVVSVYCEQYMQKMDAVILTFNIQKQVAYVHFIKQDKRLDRWVPISEISDDPNVICFMTEDKLSSRTVRKLLDEEDVDKLEPQYQQFEEAHQETTRIRNIDRITIGPYTVKAWYYSPYPNPFGKMEHIYICDHCFQYFESAQKLKEHLMKTGEKCPPGQEIYRHDNLSIFEMKGWIDKVPCQCLCLLSKLFLDHKTLFYDVEGFLFYVICECDNNGAHIAAYFSKEVNCLAGNVLSCITTLPPYQKKGYGNLCISLSYELARRSRRAGGPEKPLSDLGKLAFSSYWKDTLLELFNTRESEMTSLDNIVILTSIQKEDIIYSLKQFHCFTKVKGEYEIDVSSPSLRQAIEKHRSATPKRKIDPQYLTWLPES
ncbi:MOZ/SAS family protein [Trichomonas vaginalis G3]|uniref:Histone acetyltransferase n=1 Tax=Trichomonas vaginalis (strain ATCC PRA-98 / G3) TaxID=412133 RepID=A2FUS9_TRIV3|nr:histone acetyltransferase protein [Trichomonas vaginalis G3]EAX91343.1 MOZ/SAS family protein [Trichomonas vaginalis G3]KAI5485598.1 histone acetyltransferase protein [Trichomonas vaginalis G3]|eukprot:XP_001304273.1 MOZ/SAS family protein [Trichomonas vaginalis G3]